MQQYNSLDTIRLQNAWLTIGIFDGVHRGHQEILRRLVSGAHAAGEPAVVLTFSPHPAVVLGGKTDFKCLTTPEERLELLGSFGVDVVITQTFDRTLADQTAVVFMRRLSQTLDLRHLVIGYDTALGRGREADAARLAEIGKELGYSVQVVPALSGCSRDHFIYTHPARRPGRERLRGRFRSGSPLFHHRPGRSRRRARAHH